MSIHHVGNKNWNCCYKVQILHTAYLGEVFLEKIQSFDVFFFFFFITPKHEQKVPLPFAKSCLTHLALCPLINALFL